MGRPLRIEFPGAHYHVTSRGNERKEIFKNQKDREQFLSYLESSAHRHHPMPRRHFSQSGRRSQLQANNTRENKREAEQPPDSHRLAKQDDPKYRRTNSTDTDPDGIGGANGKRLQRNAQQSNTDHHGEDRTGGWPEPRKTIGVFQSDRPTYFKQSGKDENNPVHGDTSSAGTPESGLDSTSLE